MAKKIIALVAAIALVVCFAVSASAVTVLTTTAYTNGTEDVTVNVTVTGIDEGANVTYYATKTDGSTTSNVHIDQAKADASGAAFEFVTAATNLESTVKVGYTGASAAKDADITGYTVTYPNGSINVPNSGVTSIPISYEPSTGKVFKAITVTAGTADIDQEATKATATTDGAVTVILNTALVGDVTFGVEEEDAPIGTLTATAGHIESEALVVAASVKPEYNGGIKIDGIKESLDKDAADIEDADEIAKANADKVGDRKLTVIGQVKNTDVYGIIVSTTEITTTKVTEAAFESTYKADAYAGATKNAEGIFAIQLIDISTEEADAFVKAGETYYTAVYAQDETGAYVIEAGATVVVD